MTRIDSLNWYTDCDQLRVMAVDAGVRPIEQELNQVQQWCRQACCGTRVSYDTFQFESQEQMSAFLLRW